MTPSLPGLLRLSKKENYVLTQLPDHKLSQYFCPKEQRRLFLQMIGY